MSITPRSAFSLALTLIAAASVADTLELRDGTKLDNCFVRDEGVRLLVWENMDQIGGPAKRIVQRTELKSLKFERGDAWDVKPARADLSVTFIEITPKLAGLHGHVQYAAPWIMKPGGAPDLMEEGDRGYLHPDEVVRNLKLKHTSGEEITLAAHVKNVGFAPAAAFDYEWLIDDQSIKKGKWTKPLKEMEETTFPLKWLWQDGRHTVTFRVTTEQPEISKNNNELTDPLWGWGFTYIVNKDRAAAWHQFRSAFGTFCFEDYYRWHVQLMNTLFAASVFPSAPEGILARVRLDKIVYADDVAKSVKDRENGGGTIMDQGCWIWTDSAEELKADKFNMPSREWRTQTEWSLPHELGHQLGLIDWYAHDCDGSDDHLWPDTGERVNHFQNHPNAMMHWHGPNIYNEVDAAYLNQGWDKPRGHFGDHVFAIPRDNFLRIVDVNGNGVPFAHVEIFQRSVAIDPNAQPGLDQAVKYYPQVMDGNYDHPITKTPVIVGDTDEDGVIHLPNRPVREVVTLNGYHLRPNPFGALDCFGSCDMLVKVTKYDRPCFYWLEIYDFNAAWHRGQKDRFEEVLRTPYGSRSSPKAPTDVKVAKIDENHVKITWKRPPLGPNDQTYLARPIGYKIYRRIGNMGLNDRPWFTVATVNADTFEVVVDLTQKPQDVEWFVKRDRFAVSSIGDNSVQSELVEVVLK